MTNPDSITVYYDASCAFCSQEINNLKLYDDKEEMVLVDCSAADFDECPFAAEGITQQDMMNALHVMDSKGQWHIGVEAFEIMYRKAGLKRMAAMWGHPLIKPVAQKIYPWIVRNRYLLSKIGMVQILGLWGKVAARDAEKRAGRCKEGKCSISQKL